MIENIFPFLRWLPLAKKNWKDDLIAGLTGTIIVIPQAVAFAMIAGLPPVYGFYTALVTPVIAALFGSSYHLISGPTTAMSIVVYATISKYVNPLEDMDAYVGLTLVLTLMTGLIQLAMGLAKMGKLVNFVSHSVILGFTAGAGILIAFKQLKYVFGLPVPQGSSFYEILEYIIRNITHTNWYVFLVAMFTLVLAVVIRQFIKPIARYYMLIAMILGSVLAYFLGGDLRGIETVGAIEGRLPQFSIPPVGLDNIRDLGSGALTLALLGLIEAVAIARSIGLSSHQKIDSNQEFVGQGLSNVVASFFSSYAGSGSFTRSGVNYQAGAKTPMAAIFASFFLLIVVLLFAGYASYLAKPVMGGIILLVGYNLIDIKHIKQVLNTSKREITVLITTLFGTLFFELEIALLMGIALSLYFYLEKTARPNIAILGMNSERKFINIIRDPKTLECPQLKIIRIDGSIYFGALEVVSDYFNTLYEKGDIKHVLISAKGINFIDLAAATWLTHEAEKWKARGGGIYFSGLKIISQDILMKGGFRDQIGNENFFVDKNSAISYIFGRLDKTICEKCEARIFYECKK
jgi:SulP family sulfate permease